MQLDRRGLVAIQLNKYLLLVTKGKEFKVKNKASVLNSQPLMEVVLKLLVELHGKL